MLKSAWIGGGVFGTPVARLIKHQRESCYEAPVSRRDRRSFFGPDHSFLITVLSVSVALTRSGRAASPQAKPHDHHAPGSIIGSETPHLIPRDVILGLFLRSVNAAGSQTNVNHEKAYFNLMQKNTGYTLTDYDRKAIALAAAAYVARTTGATRVDFRAKRSQAVSEASEWLTQTLSPTGRLALEGHLEHLKVAAKILK